jgi:mitochondrial fission protein ELM1
LRPLKIVSFLDGRLGHEKQTKGVLQALSRLTPTRIEQKRVEPPTFRTGLKNWFLYLASLVAPSKETDRPVDLIIGTGAGTHIPMLLFKKECKARVVTCMSPDFPLKRAIDLCLVPRHDRQKEGDNILFTVGPPNNVVFEKEHDRGKGLILVGGVDPKSHYWRSSAVIEKIRSILEKNRSVIWTISSSPRTPEKTLLQIEKLATENPRVTFFRSEDTAGGWIEEQYARNDRVWVTADSMSMIFEALTAGCRVGILPVKWKRPNNKFQKSLNYLFANNGVTPYQSWLEGQGMKTQAAPLDEASRCAKEILRRWWPGRLK